MTHPSDQSPDRDIDLQRAWDNAPLNDAWPAHRDHSFVMRRLAVVPVESTADGASGRILEVAAAEAVHACRLARRGLACVVLEPSTAMLARARERMLEFDARLTLVRGIAETIPFRDATFDRVLCESAIDHFLHPDAAVREMTRVLRPDGRLVISFVNYASVSARLSRAAYRLWRRGAPAVPGHHLFWDSPVGIEHTFECTLPVIRTLCEPYLELERVVGVSLGWGVPGWSAVLERLPATFAERLLQALDRLAQRNPAHADHILTVWRPRPPGPPRTLGGLPIETLRVRPTDPAYHWRAHVEAARSPLLAYVAVDSATDAVARRLANTALTGDPARSWLDDLVARGPFAHAAMLGCERVEHLTTWLRAAASTRLDVYDPGEAVLDTLRHAAREADPHGRVDVRFVRADLNFLELPANRYDVVWAGGTLSRAVNLEYLLAQVERALLPAGIFALHDYVGERRLQYDPARLARVNAALDRVPVRFRLSGETPVAAAPIPYLTPLCAVRSDEVLPLAAARFETVDVRSTGALFPLYLAVDLGRLEQEAPDVLADLVAAEETATREGSCRGCGAYAVFRRRPAAPDQTVSTR